MDVISESDPNGSSSEDKASNTNSKGGTSNGNADASHSDSGDSHLSPPSKLKKCSKFSSQFNIAKMVKLIGRLTGPQKDTVTSCGFGSILSLKCTSIPNALVLWIAKHYDPKSRQFKSSSTSSFKIDAVTVHQILGIPFGGKKVPNKSSSCAKSVILKDTNQHNQAAKIDDLIAMITPQLNGDKFVRIFLLVALGIFLCPKSSATVSHQFYESIYFVKGIRDYDWSSSVADCLHLGLMNFQNNARKGNSTGKATLGGCLFVLVAAYFDYFVVDRTNIQPTLPRILVWDDIAILNYSGAQSATKDIQFKRVEDTLFNEHQMDPSTLRGFNGPDVTNAPHEPGTHGGNFATNVQYGTHNTNEQHEANSPMSPLLRPTSSVRGQSYTVDLESARKVLPGSSQLSLQVLCGESMHPDVDAFIKSTLGSEAPAEVHQHLRILCLSFFKDSVQQYVKSIEPLLVSQCCDMVKSFCTGLEQSKTATQNVSKEASRAPLFHTPTAHPNSANEATAQTDTHPCSNSPAPKDSATVNEAAINTTNNLQQAKSFASRTENGHNDEQQAPSPIVISKEMSPLISPTSQIIKDVVGDLSCTHDVDSDAARTNVDGSVLRSTPSSAHPEQVDTGLLGDKKAISDVVRQTSDGSDIEKKGSSTMSPANHTTSESQVDAHSISISAGKSKRNSPLAADISGTELCGSPVKKLKIAATKSSDDGTSKDSVTSVHRSEPNSDVPATLTETTPLEIVLPETSTKTSMKDLSGLGHKKRALRIPESFLKGEKAKAPKVVLSEFEKEVYHIATKRIRDTDPNPECVQIGRMSITVREFGDTMRPKKWLGTFVMNVFSEALMHDQSKVSKPKITKGFLTSAEVDHMKINGLDIELLKKKLHHSTIKFSLNKVDMVMIPVLHGGHWWLLVANMRDNRFDVLSSTKLTDEMKEVTSVVKTNFVRAFQAMYDSDGRINIADFRTAYQDAPQQSSNFDCGIFVMNFMRSWDGRRVAPLDNEQMYNLRAQAAVYMLCHEGNLAILPSIKKLLKKTKVRRTSKQRKKLPA